MHNIPFVCLTFQLTSAASCFKFVVTQEMEVNNVKPGYVIVFDYYNISEYMTDVDEKHIDMS